MVTQAGTIDGISYASTRYVYDSSGTGAVTDILYFNASGAQVADRFIIGLNPMYSNLKTINADGTFTLKEIPPGANGGQPKPYTLETFSGAGIWQREDVYDTPIFIDPNNPNGGISGYTESNYTRVNALGAGSSGTINGSYYDTVEAHYNAAGQLTETDYLFDLNGSPVIVAKQVAGTGTTPNPVITVPASPVAAVAGVPQTLAAVTVTDNWAQNHPGSLALNISVDEGSLTVMAGTGNPLTATPGSAIHISGTLSQLNADLAQMTFDGTPGTAHITFQVYDQAGVQSSAQEILNVSASTPSPNPVITGPAQLTGTVGTPLALSGLGFTDPWAAGHAGSLALNVSTSFGTLTGTNGSGQALAGSGTASLHATGTVAQIDADLTHLALNAAQAGAGSVSIEIYDQAGIEAVHLIGVTAHA